MLEKLLKDPEYTPALNASPKTYGGKLIKWVDGTPVPYHQKPFNSDQIKQLIYAAATLPYEGVPYQVDPNDPASIQYFVEPRFKGMTNAEVTAIRLAENAAFGNMEAVNSFYDRTLGKPKMAVETVNVSMGYQEFLDTLAKETPIDITPDSEYTENPSNKPPCSHPLNTDTPDGFKSPSNPDMDGFLSGLLEGL